MLKLIDLIRLCGVELRTFKIHCATEDTSSPLDAFRNGTWKEWQERQNKKNFECDQIMSLIHLGGSRWLFAGVFAVLGVKKGNVHNPSGYEYATVELAGLEQLTGRAIVEFKKEFRQPYPHGSNYGDKLGVSEIRGQRLTVEDFPGFNSVLVSHATLCLIVREANPSWRAALANVAGVYVITDNTTGKQYVGSAYGGVGIWQRWSDYAKSGHGGNKELQQLLTANGISHAHQLQYSIVEVCNLNSPAENVIERECHWKTVLRTREFGLNRN